MNIRGNDTTKHDAYNCICGKIYVHEKGLKRHKQTCQNKKNLVQTKYYFKDCTQSFFFTKQLYCTIWKRVTALNQK